MFRSSYALLMLSLSGCSAVGTVAESTFYSASGAWGLQPGSVRDSYPIWVKKKFYTSELLITPITYWRIKVVANEDISENIYSGSIKLSYTLDDYKNTIAVPLILESYISASKNSTEFTYIFSIDPINSLPFWQEYNESIFRLEKPWFDYFIQPAFGTNIDVTKKIKRVEYKFTPSFDFLTLAEFMNHFDFIDDDKWQEFCLNSSYAYSKINACGSVIIRD
ncbi:MAG: hypothetical protein JKY81_08350 [Colwellia sp.]|nr:hypothetical protein [Colwellia sp.]